MSIFIKLEHPLFYLLFFSIPIQSRLVLHEWTRPFNQWTSAYLYGTDILLGALLIFWFIRIIKINNGRIFNFSTNKIQNPGLFLVLFLLIVGLSIFSAQIKGLAWYQLLKLVEFVGFYFYLKTNLGKVFAFHGVLVAIIASGFVQAILGIIQYLKQGSLGVYILGESPISTNTVGVAVFITDGVKYLRAYGLTPHPNILAAWLFVAIFALYFYFLYFSTKSNPSEALASSLRSRSGSFGGVGKEGSILLIYAVLLFGLFFTFSRVIIGLWMLGVIARLLIVFVRKQFRDNPIIRQRIPQLVATSLTVIIVFSVIFWPQVKSRIQISSQEEAVTQRVFYNKAATQIAENNPWLGIGLGQFVPEMMEKFKRLPHSAYQPVHNVYLLIASETGFVGLGVFIAFLVSIFWRFFLTADFSKLHNFSFLIFVFSLLLIGLFDHFLWTSQQGSFLFWMLLAFLSVFPSY